MFSRYSTSFQRRNAHCGRTSRTPVETPSYRYLDELEEGLLRLARNPELGTSRENIRRGYRVLFIRSHAVYYKVTSAINVIRVLHVRMDADEHL